MSDDHDMRHCMAAGEHLASALHRRDECEAEDYPNPFGSMMVEASGLQPGDVLPWLDGGVVVGDVSDSGLIAVHLTVSGGSDNVEPYRFGGLPRRARVLVERSR